MGTHSVPDSKSEPVSTEPLIDIPRLGFVMWIMLGAFLIPPASVSIVGNYFLPIPNLTLWVILLGIPIPLILLVLPRSYELGPTELIIKGFVYKRRLPLSGFISMERVGTLLALFHPGSMYSSDPARAWILRRKEGRALVISPHGDAFAQTLKERIPS